MQQIAYIIAIILATSSPNLPKLDLGERVPKEAIKKTNQAVLVSPAQIQPMWLWKYQGVEYTLGVDDAGFVQFISTGSKLVSTPEGVRVGQRLADLGDVPGVYFTEWRGWGKIAELPSGWKAVCYFKGELPGASEIASDKVDALFKGTAPGYGQRK